MRNFGYLGTWGYGGAGSYYRIYRDAAPNHAATVYLYFPDATVGTDPHGDTELYTTTATPLSTHPGYFYATIPAGQTYVDVSVFPTDMIWTDGNGDLGGDANTPVTLDIMHPSALGDPDDLEAYDSQSPIGIGIMAKTTAGETWWAHVPDPAKPGQLKWQRVLSGGVGVPAHTNLDVRLKVSGQAGVAFHAETKNDAGTGSAQFTVGPVDGNLDKNGEAVFTIQAGNAPANSGGYLVVTVASTPHKLHVTIR